MAHSDATGSRSGPGTLLLLARPGDGVAETVCADHLAPDEGREVATLHVRTDRPDAALPAAPVVVVGDGTRSAAAAPATVPDGGEDEPTVVVAGDLGDAGVSVDGYLERWSAGGRCPAVCIDSVTDLIEAASVPATYRFLHVLLYRLDAVGGLAHAHADPRGHEEEIVRTFFPLFDRVVSVRRDGASPA